MLIVSDISQISTKQEKEEFISAYLEIWNCQDNLLNLSYTGIPYKQEQVVAWVNGLHENSDIQYKIAKKDNKIIGIAVLHRNGLTGLELLGLAVDKNHKKQGAATKLLENCMANMGDYKTLEAVVFTVNKPMLMLLIKHGFIPERIVPHQRYDGVDTIQLRYYRQK